MAVPLAQAVSSAALEVLPMPISPSRIASALAAITAGNNDKLANFAAWNETIDPQRADQRAFFDDIFSVAAGATTRAALNALWRRTTTRAENIFAVGTGTEASPAVLGWEGNVSLNDISDALNRY